MIFPFKNAHLISVQRASAVNLPSGRRAPLSFDLELSSPKMPFEPDFALLLTQYFIFKFKRRHHLSLHFSFCFVVVAFRSLFFGLMHISHPPITMIFIIMQAYTTHSNINICTINVWHSACSFRPLSSLSVASFPFCIQFISFSMNEKIQMHFFSLFNFVCFAFQQFLSVCCVYACLPSWPLQYYYWTHYFICVGQCMVMLCVFIMPMSSFTEFYSFV